MNAVIREYSGAGAKEMFDILEKNKSEVERILRSVRGFVSYTQGRTAEGGFTFTVCQDQAGVEESMKVARDWVAKNAAHTGVGAPRAVNASVIAHFNAPERVAH